MNTQRISQCLNMGVAGGILQQSEADEALAALTNPQDNKNTQEEFLTPKEICSIFKFTLWTFYDWKKKGFFTPYSVGGGFPKYKKSEVLNTLKKQSRTTQA